jgi:hypothetical protein
MQRVGLRLSENLGLAKEIEEDSESLDAVEQGYAEW